MSKKVMRKKYFHTNKYQRKIIALTLLPALVISILITLGVKAFHRELVDMLLFHTVSESVPFLNQWAVYILTTLWAFFALVVIGAYALSLHLVGAFERIIRELDEIIDGKPRKSIGARQKDNLANELLKRINILIKNLPEPREKLKT